MILLRSILLLLALSLSAHAIPPAMLGTMAEGPSGGGTGTDYTAHANCVGAWYMNADGSTSETDRSGEGYTLAVSTSDSIPRSTTVKAGYSGYSRDFESGDEDFLYIASASAAKLDISGADAKFTVCAWVYPESVPASGSFAHIANKYGDAGYRQYSIYLTNPSGTTYAIAAKSNDGSAVQSATGTSAISSGAWTHVCAVSDDVNVEVWVNGTREAYTASTNGIYDGANRFMIGARDTTGSVIAYPFDGLIDEVIVFDIALSESQINEIRNY
jgi:hypothetical protein